MVGNAQSEAGLFTISAQILLRQSTHFQDSRSPRMLLFYPRAGVECDGEWKMQCPGHHYTPIIELLAGGSGSLILHRFPNSFSSTLKFEISKQKDSGNLALRLKQVRQISEEARNSYCPQQLANRHRVWDP